MDSGNSGSLQSSSGGDEEYDSRAADSFFTTPHPAPPHAGGPISDQPPPLFDPLPNYIQLQQNLNPSFLNPNAPWPRPAPLRSDPNFGPHDANQIISGSAAFMPPFQPSLGSGNINPGGGPAGQNPGQAAPRNPKKRSRASRRAPTTVLTTDTTNFRSMVQEFTGIPAPPFTNSSLSRSRLDLFGTRSVSLDSPPPSFIRRPFAQKSHSPPPFLASTAAANNNFSSVSSTGSSIAPTNYQLPISQSGNLFNVPNPLLASLVQTNPKLLFSNSSAMAARPHFEIPPNDFKIGGVDEFDLGHGSHMTSTLITALPSLISSDQIGTQSNRDRDNTENDKVEARHVNGGYGFPANGKTNILSTSSSNFHGEKGPENNIGTRGEGMVESWIGSLE